MSKNMNMQTYATELSKAHVLDMLVQICEIPGNTKNFYASGMRSSFYAVDTLKRLELIREEKDGTYAKLYPTEAGRSLYTGMWYAMGKGDLVPKMQSRHLLVPFIFWPVDSYTISKGTDPGEYILTDIDTGNTMMAYDVYITDDGDMWFSIEGSDSRFMLDLDEEDVDTGDLQTQECIKEIVEDSRKKAEERMKRNYEDLVNFSEEPDEEE